MSSGLEQLRNNVAHKLRTNKEFFRILLAELLGTLFLVAIGDGAVAQFVLANDPKFSIFLAVNFAYAFAIAFGVYICGGISGGHINPAVTLCMCIFGRCDWAKLPAYFIGQFTGAFLGSAVIFTTYYDALVKFDSTARIAKGLPNNSHWIWSTAGIYGTYPQEYMSTLGCYYDQMVGTAILLIVVFAVTDAKNMQVPKFFVPLLVGLGVGAIGMSYGLNAGYAINPARDLAPRFFTLIAGWGSETFAHKNYMYFLAPVVGPFLGAIVGGTLYQACVGIHWPQVYEIVKTTDEPQGRVVETTIGDPKAKINP